MLLLNRFWDFAQRTDLILIEDRDQAEVTLWLLLGRRAGPPPIANRRLRGGNVGPDANRSLVASHLITERPPPLLASHVSRAGTLMSNKELIVQTVSRKLAPNPQPALPPVTRPQRFHRFLGQPIRGCPLEELPLVLGAAPSVARRHRRGTLTCLNSLNCAHDRTVRNSASRKAAKLGSS